MSETWEQAQQFEHEWWGDCCNTVGEQLKQQTYARKMGFTLPHDFGGKKIIDVGCGPVSMLLKCTNVGPGSVVADPGDYPQWVTARYEHMRLTHHRMKGEDIDTLTNKFDIALCYNVLQHVEDPEKICRNMRAIAKEVRIFEWSNHGVCPGHPHDLKPHLLNEWLGGEGKVEKLNEPGLHGECYYGIFKGNG